MTQDDDGDEEDSGVDAVEKEAEESPEVGRQEWERILLLPRESILAVLLEDMMLAVQFCSNTGIVWKGK